MMTIPTFDPWVVRPKPNPQARLRLFCFPYAGGGASVFRTWPDFLPGNIELCAIQLPGREARLGEAPFTELSPLIQKLAQVLQPYLNVPFVFFGHSLGSLVCFELARQLRRQGSVEPLHLFVAGRRAPEIPESPLIHHLPEPEFIAELRHLNGTAEVVLDNKELMQLMLPLLRADFALNERYVYTSEAPFEFPISAFGGLQDNEVSREQLSAWQKHTNGDFSTRMFSGDHFFLHSAQSQLLQVILQKLDVIKSTLVFAKL